jgi:FAD/FMN-containing dehydrogenase
MSIIAEAGVILADLHRAAESVGRYFPLSLASEGSCTIGGNLSTNAGGVNVLRYGNTRELTLGMEVVLADGRVLDLLRTLRKDNTGYDLKQVFIGAEGTLGIITAAALKLFAAPQEHATALMAVQDVESAIKLLAFAQEATGGLVSAFELISRLGLAFVLAHIPDTADPFDIVYPWYVLIEATAGTKSTLQETFADALGEAVSAGIASNGIMATSETQRARYWHLRESLSEAQKREGASIKHDVSVPIEEIPYFLRRGIDAVQQMIPAARPVPFGHLGDGNIHFNFSAPKGGDDAVFLARWDEVNRTIHDIVREFGGSISAEHGVGVLKREEIVRTKSAAEIEIMRALKRTLDPNNILNPGKVVSV